MFNAWSLRRVVQKAPFASIQLAAGLVGLSSLSHAQVVTPPPAQILAAYYGDTPGSTTLAELVKSGAALHLTHLIYAFAVADSTNPCRAAPKLSASDLQSLKTLRSANAGLKILISVGGQNSATEFHAAASDASFPSTCVSTLMADTPNQGFQFDGIDIDWEVPGSDDGQNFNTVLSEFRTALNAYQQNNHLVERLLLTAVIAPEYNSGGWEYIDFSGATYPPGATSSVDFFNVEFYDYVCACDGITESNAPLYEINADLYGNTSVYGAGKGIITDGKVPPSKIVLGIPFYGVHFTGVTSGTTLSQPGTLEVDSQQATVTYPYYELASKSGTLYNDGNGSTGCSANPAPVTCDGIGGSAWIWNSSSGDLWAFDNPETISQKTQYAQNQQLGGIMSWNLMDDTPTGTLLNAMATSLASNHIIIGPSGSPWGINAAGRIFQFNSSSWSAVPGSMAQIAIGPNGDVWAVSFTDKLFHWVTGSSPYWQIVNGKFKQVAVGTNYLWALTAAGAVYYTDAKPASNSSANEIAWSRAPGVLLASMALNPASDTSLWGINGAGKVYAYSGGSWVPRGGSFSHLAVSASTVAALNAQGDVYQWNGASWQKEPGLYSQVAVTESGDLWAITTTGHVWELTAGSSTWSPITGKTLREIGFGSNLWGLNALGEIYEYNSGFTRVPGTL
jgi:chitinase